MNSAVLPLRDLRRAAGARGRRVRTRLRLPGGIGRLLPVAAIALLVVLAGVWLIVRDSGMVAVERVKVVGLEGYYDRVARQAVASEARTMTTLNVDEDALAAAAGRHTEVVGVRVERDLPHGLTVFVSVRRPVAVMRSASGVVGVTADGQVLAGAQGLAGLPRVDLTGAYTGGAVTDVKARAVLTVLGAAPDVLLRKVQAVRWGSRGLTLRLQKGVTLYFGNSVRAGQKWAAVATVLAGGAAEGAAYVDVRVPDRPAVGGLGPAPVTAKKAPLEEPIVPDPTIGGAPTGAVGAAPAAGAVSKPAAPAPSGTPTPAAPGGAVPAGSP